MWFRKNSLFKLSSKLSFRFFVQFNRFMRKFWVHKELINSLIQFKLIVHKSSLCFLQKYFAGSFFLWWISTRLSFVVWIKVMRLSQLQLFFFLLIRKPGIWIRFIINFSKFSHEIFSQSPDKILINSINQQTQRIIYNQNPPKQIQTIYTNYIFIDCNLNWNQQMSLDLWLFHDWSPIHPKNERN